MAVIDAHVHLYPDEVNRDPAGWAAAQGEAQWALMCTRRRKSGRAVQGFPSVDDLLRAMDAAGVERSVLLGWYWEQPASCVKQNRFFAGCVRAFPDRLSAFATVHPGAGDAALEEIWRAKGEGFVGLGELSPQSQGVPADEATWGEILGLAGDLGLPVNLHVTDPAGRPYPGRVETPRADFVGWAQRYPGTSFILAHWGGGLALGAEGQALPNVWYDTAASPLLYGSNVWRRGLGAVGAERVLFGSDYPLVLYPELEMEATAGGLLAEARAELSPLEAEAVLGGNAARLLGLG